MRKNYFLAALAAAVLSVGSLVAQPTITSANSGFVAGDTHNLLYIDPAGFSAGPAGANQTWDFSQLTPTGNQLSMSVHQVAGSPYQNQFPGASLYSESQGTQDFWVSNATEWSRRGALIPSQGSVDYSNTQMFMSYPFTFNSNFNDPFAGSIVTSGFTMQRSGTMVGTADGYGTLILPGGQTHANVLRVKYQESGSDQFAGTTIGSYTGEHYMWYKPDFHGPLLVSNKVMMNGQVQQWVYVTASITTSANDLVKINANVYPNPAKGNLHFVANFSQATEISAILLNGVGQQVRTQQFTVVEAGAPCTMSVEGLPAGIYFLQLQSGRETAISKVVVE